MGRHGHLLVIAVTLSIAYGSLGCLEYRIDENNDIPAIAGTVQTSFGVDFTCGDTVGDEPHTVTTKEVAGGCEIVFKDEYTLLTAQDYESISSLQSASNLLRRFELEVRKLSFIDDNSNEPMDLQTQFTSLVVQLNGQRLFDRSLLVKLPTTITLTGQIVRDTKKLMAQKQPVVYPMRFVAVIPDTTALPEKLRIEYQMQPAIIVGP